MSYDSDSFSMIDLFRMEVETQISRLNQDLLALEKSSEPAPLLESLMRAAHSTKGAARLVGVLPAERLAHSMEDLFVAAQAGRVVVDAQAVDTVLKTSDLLLELGRLSEADLGDWEVLNKQNMDDCIRDLTLLLEGKAPQASSPAPKVTPVAAPAPAPPPAAPAPKPAPPAPAPAPARASAPSPVVSENKTMRLAADHLDLMVHLAGEAKVLASWLGEFGQSLIQLKTRNAQLQSMFLEMLASTNDPLQQTRLQSAQQLCADKGTLLYERMETLSNYDRRLQAVSGRLYHELLNTRMRPFADAVQNMQRLVRDLGRELGKEVQLTMEGLDTPVDREILERLEGALTQLVRNALDHGLENSTERLEQSKDPVGTVGIHAYHSRGWLYIKVSDDGRGLDVEAIRWKLVDRGLSTPEVAERLSVDELTEFIFLPGFSSRTNVTEISGRGVGLDLVRQTLSEVGGHVICQATPGRGLIFEIRLPIAVSILHCLLVEVAGQVYALPLARLEQVAQLKGEQVTHVEGRPWWAEERVSLTMASQILGFGQPAPSSRDTISVVAFTQQQQKLGLVVDAFLNKQKLVAQPIDPRLGKIPHVSAGAVLQDGSPTLILDVDDLISTMSKTLEDWQQDFFPSRFEQQDVRKRVLVVDDSITVREVERNLLRAMGFHVDVAVDGMDGWNAVRSGHYDLVVSDLDMPRMDGFELIRLIKSDPQLEHLRIIIVSYKDREEDKLRGLEVGADCYLTKASFHDHQFAQAVKDLIGSCV